MTRPVFYAKPDAVGRALSVPAALGSRDRAGSPGQARSAAFVADVQSLIGEQLAVIPDPLALRLDIGLPPAVPLLGHHDLDNYLLPLVPMLTAATGQQFASVWATKRHAVTSSVSVSTARATRDPGGVACHDVATTASSERTAYKEQVHGQVCGGDPLPDGEVSLQLAFAVGPRRAWPNLWKATIDSLGPLLGHDAAAPRWSPRDGRITSLGLHCLVDPAAGNRVDMAVRAQ
ncbi:hypothetical protein GCM10010123_19810 [Pilimelia anulata]|uniref:Uncharacterized protein n=1 Tax=Pilimelia anulata TaxID=53371 RepID=A0A8J3B6Z2_9ACTN|nr:hypothetical protein [Pilimelia anulata]GGJ90007.1 hypothetical protein GCM10010123_19810 [Pilimelia anulata]